jgi:hypothetical protein
MSVTVTARKTVGFRSPYTGDTFQELTEKIIGRDGYLTGGETSDDAANITVGPVAFVQGGLVAETEADATGISVPTGAEPWFVVAAIPDDDPVSGVQFSVTRDLGSVADSVIIAFKSGGAWYNPVSANVQAAFTRATEAGVEHAPLPALATSAGIVTDIAQGRAQVVDPDGMRKLLERAGSSSVEALSLSALGGHSQGAREDVIAIRQIEPYTSGIEYLIGDTDDVTGRTALSSTGTRIGVYAKRGGSEDTERWAAYGSGTLLRIRGGFGGTGFLETTLVTGSGNIGDVWIAGQRSGDDAIVVLYTDSGNVRMVSFNATTGALVDAATTIDTQTGICQSVRAELDLNDKVHVVYEHDDGSEQQVYYTKVDASVSGFGSADVTPRRVTENGLTSSLDDTRPDIAVDRQGVAHIVFTSGTPPTTDGNFGYATIDQNGAVASRRIYLVATEVGRQASIDIPADGFVASAVTTVRCCRVMVTPHDEVYAIACDTSTNNEVLLFSPTFEDRLGFPLVNVMDEDGGTGVQNGDLYAADIESSELGQILIVAASLDVTEHYIDRITLDTAYAPAGAVSRNDSTFDHGNVVSELVSSPGDPDTDEGDIILRRGGLGEMIVSRRMNNTNVNEVVDYGVLMARRPTPHPKDVYLSKVVVPKPTLAGDPTAEPDLGIFNTRLKKMNYPILVGNGGDFQGFEALHQAVEVANRVGGTIIVRQGDYRAPSAADSPWTLHLYSGVSIIGEGRVHIDGYQIQVGYGGPLAGGSFAGNIFQRAWALGGVLREGDLVFAIDSGFYHRVLAVLAPDATYATRLLLSNAPNGSAPGGTSLAPYAGGNRLENLVFETYGSSSSVLVVWRCEQPYLKNIAFHGEFNASSSGHWPVSVSNCHSPVVEGLDFRQLYKGSSLQNAIQLNSNADPVVRDCHADPNMQNIIEVLTTNTRPSVIGCTGMKVTPASATRTSPLFLVGGGADASNLDTYKNIITNVGQVLRTEPGMGAMHLQDENTRNGTTINIPFSDSDNDDLPDNYGSVLETLKAAPESVYEYGCCVVSGCEPVQNTFPQITITNGSYFAEGKKVAFSQQSNNDATTASTQYVYYTTADGTIYRSTTANYMGGKTYCAIAIGVTNSGNTAWDSFLDLRRYQPRINFNRPVYARDFETIPGAIKWMQQLQVEHVELVIDDMYTIADADLPMNLYFTSGKYLKSLTIRGLGEHAGFTLGTNQNLFNLQGLPSKNAANSFGQKCTLRFHNLLLDSTNTTAGTTWFNFIGGYFTDLVIDECRTRQRHNATSFVAFGSATTIDRITIANNQIEDCGENAAVLDFTDATVEHLNVFDNTIKQRGNDAYEEGVVVPGTVVNCWIARNSFVPGYNASGGFLETIKVTPRSYSEEGCRYIVDNYIESSTGTGDDAYAIHIVDNTGTTVEGPVFVANNFIKGDFKYGIIFEVAARASRIIDNHIDVGLPSVGLSYAIQVQGGVLETIAGNYIYMGSSTTYAGTAIDAVSGEKVTIDGNRIYYSCTTGISAGGTTGGCVITNNHLDGNFTTAITTAAPQSAVTGNRINNGKSTGRGIAIGSTAHYSSVVGNTVYAEGSYCISVAADWCGISGNACEHYTDDATAYCFYLTGDRCAASGNTFHRSRAVVTSLYGVVEVTGSDNIITGNFIQGYDGGLDYGVGDPGHPALRIWGGDRCVVVGNQIFNRGDHSQSATVKIGTGCDNGVFVGNVIRNPASSPVYMDNSGSGWEFGTAGSSVPGSSKQVNS